MVYAHKTLRSACKWAMLKQLQVRVVEVGEQPSNENCRGFKVRTVPAGKGDMWLYGWLPCYSPGIEYTLKVDSKNRVVCRVAWKRVCWWLEGQYLLPIFKKGYVKPNLVEQISQYFVKPRSSEDDLSGLKPYCALYGLFRRHFWPSVWFDVAMMRSGEDNNKYSPSWLERNADHICKWQVCLDLGFSQAFLFVKPPLYQLSLEEAEALLSVARNRLEHGLLSKIDQDCLKEMETRDKSDKHIVGRPSRVAWLVHPKEPMGGYSSPADIERYAYRLLQEIRTKLSYGDCSLIPFPVPPKQAVYITENGIASEVSPGKWTLPIYMNSARQIVQALRTFGTAHAKPSNLVEALALPLCAICTKGHNAFEVLRSLTDKMEAEKIAFICPTQESAALFLSQTDAPCTIIPGNIKMYTETLVFCFAEQFSLKLLAKHLKELRSTTKRLIFIGDPQMASFKGVGQPFTELVACNALPRYDLVWASQDSYNVYSNGVRDLISVFETPAPAESIPWSDSVQLCSPESFKELYGALLKENDADPDKYHILCDTHATLREIEGAVRTKPPHGIRLHEKVWIPSLKRLDWVQQTSPVRSDGSGFDSPMDLVLANRTRHSLALHRDTAKSHKDCCGTTISNHLRPLVHGVEWATVQAFRDNRTLMRSHVVVVPSIITTRRWLYTVACISICKVTLVTTLPALRDILSKKERRAPSLIELALQ